MKRLMTLFAALAIFAVSASAMSLSKARTEALFLSDKMAYELSLSLSQYEAVYEINLDYMLGLSTIADLEGVYWMRRNADLHYVLSGWQWERYTQIADFYRPMSYVKRNSFDLILRSRYTQKHSFFYERPAIYGSYRGGHNAGNQSYYANRDFHKPTASTAPHYGSSAPQPYGTTHGSTRGNPSYHSTTPPSHNATPAQPPTPSQSAAGGRTPGTASTRGGSRGR
ncbi:MAG: hypothetical protein IJ767_08845 [Bacteroidaceae bacterium]|nr:hypothetical protein [Bacteroidaceae bacterium]MBR1755094.1 hypothetical protein [Bacteroidaceae bacterium]MBR1801575.1 hypothetical protein [Bacteroidaceae bacterium]